MADRKQKPAYGKCLIAHLIDDRAKTNPRGIAFSIQRSADMKQGFQDVTNIGLASAISEAAHWIQKTLGRSSNFETLAYIGPSDLRYAILTIACQKTGYKAFFPSPRNSLAAHLSLLEALDCNKFLVPESAPSPVKAILDKRPMKTFQIPTMNELLDAVQVEPYSLFKTFEEARLEPFAVLHTSGSTGLPKPVVVAQGTMASGDGFLDIPSFCYEPTIYESWKNERVFLGLPLFHAAGQLCLFTIATPYNTTLVLGPPDVSVTDESANAIHVHGDVKASLLAPSLLEEIVKTPSFLENLSKLKWAAYAGGPLAKSAGDAIRARTSIQSFLGATETALLPIEAHDMLPEDWQYLKFSPCLGTEFRHHDGDHYELFIIRDPRYESVQGVFSTFPELSEYSMKDVYSKHPSRPDFWRFEGRTDDIIIFSNTEKLNPVTIEGIVGAHPDVRSALVIGTGYFQSSLLIEAKDPPASEADQTKLRDIIWPYVQQANQDSPDYASISKDLIIFTPPNKPMLRAGKGTVQRKATALAFKQEIDRAYGIWNDASTVTWIDIRNRDSLRSTLRDIVSHELATDELDDSTCFNEIGLDSLHVMNMVRKINASLDHSDKSHVRVTQHTVYYNPSINRLAAAIKELADREAGQTKHAPGARVEGRIQHMQALLAANTADIPITARAPIQTHERRKTVILTGSTGSLGSYLLDRLLADKDVVEIVCFERVHFGISVLDRQKQAMKAHGLTIDISPDKVSFIEVDLSQPYFGLSRPVYMELLRTVTHILHDAWEVNFELPLESFIPTHIQGVRSFIDFSIQSHHGAFIFFISSISSVSNWPTAHQDPAPERIIEDWSVAGEMGYAESKLLSERILASASALAGVPTATCRVGQIAGPTTKTGMWSKREWFPRIVASSKYLNMIPETLAAMDTVDWIPVDVLAQILIELLFEASLPGRTQPNNHSKLSPVHSRNGGAQFTTETQIFHTTNPSTTSYSKTLLPSLLAHLPHDVKKVPFAEWASALAGSKEDPEHNPGQKLVDFYEDLAQKDREGQRMVVLNTSGTAATSETLRGLGPVQAEWMETWMEQWGFKKQ